MFYEIYIALLVIVVFLAALFDIRNHVIPPELSLGLVGAAIVLKFVEAGVYMNPNILIDALLSGFVAFLVLYVLWKFGFIAGGDVKLLSGISILLPSVFKGQTFGIIRNTHLLFIPLIWNGILVVSPFLFAYLLYISRNGITNTLVSTLKTSLGASFLLFTCFSYFKEILALVMTLILGLLPAKWLLLLIPAIFAGLQFGWTGLLTTFLFVFSLDMYLSILLGSRGKFKYKQDVYKLVEGDILASPVEFSVNGKNYKLRPESKGLSSKDIHLLVKSGMNHVYLQPAIPFTPIILIGLLVSIFIGDLLWVGVKLL